MYKSQNYNLIVTEYHPNPSIFLLASHTFNNNVLFNFCNSYQVLKQIIAYYIFILNLTEMS